MLQNVLFVYREQKHCASSLFYTAYVWFYGSFIKFGSLMIIIISIMIKWKCCETVQTNSNNRSI